MGLRTGDEKSRCATSIRNEEETEPTQINPVASSKKLSYATPRREGERPKCARSGAEAEGSGLEKLCKGMVGSR